MRWESKHNISISILYYIRRNFLSILNLAILPIENSFQEQKIILPRNSMMLQVSKFYSKTNSVNELKRNVLMEFNVCYGRYILRCFIEKWYVSIPHYHFLETFGDLGNDGHAEDFPDNPGPGISRMESSG